MIKTNKNIRFYRIFILKKFYNFPTLPSKDLCSLFSIPESNTYPQACVVL